VLRLRDGSSLTARLRRFPGGKAGAGKKGFELREVCAIIIVEKNPDALNTAARPLWECRGGIRDRVRRNAAKPCNTCVCGIFPDYRKRHKSGFDHRNDHRQKKL